jgi:Raf kinase inhibitor-like YbhB/YbcL family protein
MTDQAPHPEHSGQALTIQRVNPILDTGILVTCPVQEASGRLPDRHSAYHDNISPPLQWSSVPDVQAWAIVVEDPDAPQEEPFIHWMIWNIGGQTTALPEGIGNEPRLLQIQDAIQGRNGRGGYGWFGPRPPPGHGVHRYYVQVFALNERIEMGPDTPLNELLNALKARTIAQGEMMATYEAPTEQ